ncbi:Rpr2-domain-containing protein [Heliocybe sulcata]|uniref:Rpr2-domain-containing protein n=1 Tax=Heliocybe sulcata TaxID=5364 RepID=A0A5C3N9K7_9AGAM|nr:Rpr2-domain-containing protein [Heliocybe sulcata]
MAKKNREEAPNPNNISSRDILQRMNFLYQAGAYLSTLPAEASSREAPHPAAGQKRRKARAYVDSMRTVGQRTVVKLDPSVKRTLCRSCNLILIPGTTATVRIKSSPSHEHVVTYTCTTCNSARRIPAPPVLVVNSEVKADKQAESSSTNVGDPQAAGPVENMDVDAQGHKLCASKTKRRRTNATRLPPFFERPVGHVVFRGNDKVPEIAM